MLDLKIPQTASALVNGCFNWDKEKQHELGYYAEFPPFQDTQSRVEFDNLTIC